MSKEERLEGAGRPERRLSLFLQEFWEPLESDSRNSSPGYAIEQVRPLLGFNHLL